MAVHQHCIRSKNSLKSNLSRVLAGTDCGRCLYAWHPECRATEASETAAPVRVTNLLSDRHNGACLGRPRGAETAIRRQIMSEEQRDFPGFTRRPPDEEKEPQWQIIRCGGTETLRGMCLSHDLLGCYTHFFRGRTTPCTRPKTCEACEAGNVTRWHAWIAAMNVRRLDRAIVELTFAAMPQVDESFCRFRTLRGLDFEITRRGGKQNGRLVWRAKAGTLPQEQVPRAPDLPKMLLRMWEVSDVLKFQEAIEKTPIEQREIRRASQ